MKKITTIFIAVASLYFTSFAATVDVQNNTNHKINLLFSNQYSDEFCTRKQCYIPEHITHETSPFTALEMSKQQEEHLAPTSTVEIKINDILFHREQLSFAPGEHYLLNITEIRDGGLLRFTISLYWINSEDNSKHPLCMHNYYPGAAVALAK